MKSQWGFYGTFVKSGITGVKTPQLTDKGKFTGDQVVEKEGVVKSFKAPRRDRSSARKARES